ncbi:MFS general substrate transporter [Acephala macrosclerotiorum]|nr:MFS general substrate transporter [Acephala macrosclerotiorum]
MSGIDSEKKDSEPRADALATSPGHDTPQAYRPGEEQASVRRIDLYIMPLICIVYFLQYLDKISIGYGSVMGLRKDAHLTGDDYNWVSSIFFFGHVNVIIWGAILACLATCKNFASLMVCRALLGCAEAAIVPGWVVFTSQWYRKEDQAFRVGIWLSMCGFAQMFGGYVAYGIATHVGKDPHAALKGCLIGVVFFFVLPDSPLTAEFLSPEQKALHAEHLRGNEQGIGTKTFKKEQVWEALRDPNTWLYSFWVFAANVPNSITTSFSNILVTGMGYSSTESLLLVTPLGAYEVVVLIGLTWLAMKTNQRHWCCIAGHMPSIIDANLMATTEKAPALKFTVACIGTIACTVGNIISPHTFQVKDAPRYLPAKISIVILYFLITVDLYAIRWLAAELGDAWVVEKNHEFLDLTDRQNLEFRYSV